MPSTVVPRRRVSPRGCPVGRWWGRCKPGRGAGRQGIGVPCRPRLVGALHQRGIVPRLMHRIAHLKASQKITVAVSRGREQQVNEPLHRLSFLDWPAAAPAALWSHDTWSCPARPWAETPSARAEPPQHHQAVHPDYGQGQYYHIAPLLGGRGAARAVTNRASRDAGQRLPARRGGDCRWQMGFSCRKEQRCHFHSGPMCVNINAVDGAVLFHHF
jgi:hypothetical protein